MQSIEKERSISSADSLLIFAIFPDFNDSSVENGNATRPAEEVKEEPIRPKEDALGLGPYNQHYKMPFYYTFLHKNCSIRFNYRL